MIHFLSNGEFSVRSSAANLVDNFLMRYYSDVVKYSKEEMKPDNQDLLDRSNFVTFHLLPAVRVIINTQSDELILKSSFKIFKRYLI